MNWRKQAKLFDVTKPFISIRSHLGLHLNLIDFVMLIFRQSKEKPPESIFSHRKYFLQKIELNKTNK